MEGLSDNLRSDGCGVEARQDLSQLALGSSLSGAEVAECTSPPYYRLQGCLCLSLVLCLEGSLGPSPDPQCPSQLRCICPPLFCTRHFPDSHDGDTAGWTRSRWPGEQLSPPFAGRRRSCLSPVAQCTWKDWNHMST